MNNVIIDVGANDGLDGLGYALFNRHLKIYAFEPNPELIKLIKNNKKKIENFFGFTLDNYQIYQKAISNYNGKNYFYISEYDLCSSLLKFKFVKIKKKIPCEIITLNKFCKNLKIDNIVYLHCDAQGSDLNVLKGLGKYKKKLHSGVIETMNKEKDRIYRGESSFKDFKSFFLRNKFKITGINPFNKENKILNIYFKNNSILKKNFLYKNEFNRRFLARIIQNKTTIKDRFFKIYLYHKFKV